MTRTRTIPKSSLLAIGLLLCLPAVSNAGWTTSYNETDPNIFQIAYGTGSDYPQYAALYLDSGYFRMIYGKDSSWGTSIILLPVIWEEGSSSPLQGGPIAIDWQIEGDDIVILYTASYSSIATNLDMQGTLRISPPHNDTISATVSISTAGSCILANRPGEAFKTVMFSSMHISPGQWDAKYAYANNSQFAIPSEGWITGSPAVAQTLGLYGGSSAGWEANKPTVEVELDRDMDVTGWVTNSTDPNDDNVGYWAAADSVLDSWKYTITAKKADVNVKNDFDGDGRSDIGCYNPTGGNWYGLDSTAGFWSTQFGYTGTLPITGDFDGDGTSDFGCYYAPGGNWYVMKSSEGFATFQFGYEGTIPIVGDFDGDGKDDFGCYHPPSGNWYVMKSTEGFWVTQFGYAGTIPIVADFDGDGRDDIGCYYPAGGNWYVMKSSEGFATFEFGYAGTIPIVGDFDADGKDDFGCYYPPTGNWYVMSSTEGFWVTQFGYTGTEPVVGDFDGDGRAEIGCYYPTGGNWYVMKSSEGFWITQFGYEGTIPLGGTLR